MAGGWLIGEKAIKVGWRTVKFSIYECAIVSRTEKFLGKLAFSSF